MIFFTYVNFSGCNIGCPASPIALNLVLEDIENRALNNLSFKPILYKRYVEDITAFVSSDQIDEFRNTFNNIP